MLKIKIPLTAAIVALVTISIALTLTTYAAISTTQNLNTNGSITTSADLTVYSDSSCLTPINSINWGTLNPGQNTTRSIYIQNTGNGVSLTLNMTTSNWSSGANGPICLSWNQEGTKLNPGQAIAADLTLSVSSTIVDVSNFSVQINIIGTNP